VTNKAARTQPRLGSGSRLSLQDILRSHHSQGRLASWRCRVSGLLPLWLALTAVALIAACGRDSQPPPSSYLAKTAAAAKAQNRPSSTIRYTDEPIVDVSGLDSILQTYSTITATPSTVVVKASDDRIYSWYLLTKVQHLSRRPPALREYCGMDIPPQLRRQTGDVVLPLLQGSVVIDGVAIHAESFQSNIELQTGATYLLFILECDNGVAALPIGDPGVLLVRNQRVSSPFPEVPFVSELLKTTPSLDTLHERIRQLAPR
jgi:hypothetical protein